MSTDRIRTRLASALEVVSHLDAAGVDTVAVRISANGAEDITLQVPRGHAHVAARALGIGGAPAVRGDVDRCIATYDGEWNGWRVHLFGPIDLTDLYERRPVDAAAVVNGHGPAAWRNAEGDVQ